MAKKKFPVSAFLTYHILKAPVRMGARLLSLPRRPVAYPGGPAAVAAPIFVVGPLGSGVSAVGKALDRHSRIACPGETWFLAGLIEQLRSGFFVRGLQGLGVWREEAVANIRGFALSYYGGFLHRAGKPRFADASSAYCLYGRELGVVFGPGVKVIHVLRHGLDVVHWMRDRECFMVLPPLEPPDQRGRMQAAARLWRGAAERARALQVAHPSSHMTVRFEDLAERPDQILGGVLAFLGEEREPGMVEAAGPAIEALRSATGAWRAWPPEQLTAVREVIGEGLSRCGYEP